VSSSFSGKFTVALLKASTLLRWKGIEATSHLAESSNSKVVIIGGKDGLPLIFNVGEEVKPAK
jgi:prohibitin 2